MLELTSIMQRAGHAKTPEDQVRIIVDAISAALGTDVCSLYIPCASGDMALVASHGLNTRHPVVLPQGSGLVGRVTTARHSINIIDPDQEPDYFYLPQSREEQFHSFCGVPLVQQGRVVGVLVVQSRKREILDVQGEAFLSTLASHLALLVDNLPDPVVPAKTGNETIYGIGGAPGLAMGRVRKLATGDLQSVPDGQCDDPALEVQHWHTLKTEVIADLMRERHVVEMSLGQSLSTIFDAYRMLLEDPSFTSRIEREIDEGSNLPSALRKTVRFFSEQFLDMEDPYLKARHEDIEQLGDKVYQAWLGDKDSSVKAELDSEFVLIGNNIGVSDIVNLPAEQLLAIVCNAGAALSHIAIFANALGIPAVMGLQETRPIADGEYVIVDGDVGQLIRDPSENLIAEYRELIDSRRNLERQLEAEKDLRAQTTDGIDMQLMANSGLQADIMPGLRRGADGIGLFRTEVPFMARQGLPSEEEQVAVYRQVIDAYGDKPVYMRTLDIGGDKPLPYLPHVIEENPALGWRGVRFTLDNIQLLVTQLRAIVRAAEGRKSVHVLFPMVSTTEELDTCLELLDDSCRQLAQEGYPSLRPRVGVMLEVPGAISLLPFWRERLDFISIGSNDLSQYLLAIDRNNPIVGKLYDPLHPAVIHEIARIVSVANKLGLPVSVCGEIASDPIAVVLLIGLGVRQLSMSSARLPLIRSLVRSISMEAAKDLVQQAMTRDTASGIRDLCLEYLGGLERKHQFIPTLP